MTQSYREGLSADRLDNPAVVQLSLAKGNEFLFWFSYERRLWFTRYRKSTDLAEALRIAGLAVR